MPKIKVGDTIRIIKMEGEPYYTGKVGVVKQIDDMGQIHGTWGGCALLPNSDVFEVIRPITSDDSNRNRKLN